jgi:hypothetical protein
MFQEEEADAKDVYSMAEQKNARGILFLVRNSWESQTTKADRFTKPGAACLPLAGKGSRIVGGGHERKATKKATCTAQPC